jgi:hypothetical protein
VRGCTCGVVGTVGAKGNGLEIHESDMLRLRGPSMKELPTASCAVSGTVNILNTVWLVELCPALSCGTYLVEYPAW